ncbi:MAG: nucleotidyltransferase domain-containing protein [Methanobacteriaceae archaeon]|jgi:DNA-binding Lrp family transcriptional regulator
MKKKDVNVLKVLIEKGEERISIAKLSKKLKMDYKNTYNIVKRLEKGKLILLEKHGNVYSCKINKIVHPSIFESEFDRKKSLLENSDFKILYQKLNSLPFSFIALIFGSYAKGSQAKGSDIDLMVISEKDREKEIEGVISLLPLNIHLVFLTYEEFMSMARSKEFSVVSEVIECNIILIGIEDYYRLMENVG